MNNLNLEKRIIFNNEYKKLSLEEKQIILNNLLQKIQTGDNSLELLEKYNYIHNDIEKIKKNTEILFEGFILGTTYKLNTIIEHKNISNKNASWWKEEFGNINFLISDKTLTVLQEIIENKFKNYLPQNKNYINKLFPVIKIKLYSEDMILEDKNLTYLLNTFFAKNKFCWIYNTYLNNIIFVMKQQI